MNLVRNKALRVQSDGRVVTLHEHLDYAVLETHIKHAFLTYDNERVVHYDGVLLFTHKRGTPGELVLAFCVPGKYVIYSQQHQENFEWL